VDDLLHDTTHVPIALGKVVGAQAASTFPVLGVRGEDGPATLTLSTDDAT